MDRSDARKFECAHDWQRQETVGPPYDECSRCEKRQETLGIGGDLAEQWITATAPVQPPAPDPDERVFTAAEVIEIANETSDSLGNLYRLDFIDRINHEAEMGR